MTYIYIYIYIYFLTAFSQCKTTKAVTRQAVVAQGVPGRLRHRIFSTFRHYKGGRFPAKGTGRLYPQENSLVLIFIG